MKIYALLVVSFLAVFTFGVITFTGGYALGKYTYEQGETK